MAVDVVVPHENAGDLAEFAKNLGFSELILLYRDLNDKTPLPRAGILLKRGVFVHKVNDISAAKSKFDYIFAPAERQFFESKNVDFVIDAESSPLKDLFYQRRSGLDDAICKLAKANGITVVFNVSSASDKVILGRMKQNAKLCRKHKLNFLCASFAAKKLDMRAKNDLDAFARFLTLV